MPYGKSDEIKNSNVNYSGRDFNDLKSSLIDYSKSYFPNIYRDFNETSPGMMLLELNAYVGDVLNFYIDQQYREMMLPLAEERRNILTLAKSHGYKVNPISPAYVDLTLKMKVGALDDGKIDYTDAITLDKGMRVSSNVNTEIKFETLDIVDFKISSSADAAAEISDINGDTGVPSQYTLTRKVKAISGETKTFTKTIGTPSKFFKLTLPENNVIEVIKVVDSNNNIWYEVESLAQDKIPTSRHYTSDENRSTGYSIPGSSNELKLPVPYSLEYVKTGKRFITEVNEDSKTILTFGNGMLKNGNSFNSTFLAIEQVGINLPGGIENLETDIDPLLGDAYGTLGEAPANTTLTITYRVGGGITSNISSNQLTTIDASTTIGSGNSSTLTVNNDTPAAGGSSGETNEEIRQRAMSHISTQNRCVSKEDYEARTLNMSAKYGNIAKVYCSRAGSVRNNQRKKVADIVGRLKTILTKNNLLVDENTTPEQTKTIVSDIKQLLDANQSGAIDQVDPTLLYETLEMAFQNITQDDRLYTIDLYLMSYDSNKQLTQTPTIIKQNLKNYLNQFRLLTDQVSFYDGYVINFGVVFDVVAMPYENKDELKIKCIQVIKDYFTIDKMQFKQVIYTNDLENLLMDVDGTRAVNYVTITQNFDYNSEKEGKGSETPVFSPGLYNTVIQSDGSTTDVGNSEYGYYYDFSKFYGSGNVAGKGVILPAYEPSVFELKNPNDNIKGIVR